MRNINKNMVEASDLRVGLVKIELWYSVILITYSYPCIIYNINVAYLIFKIIKLIELIQLDIIVMNVFLFSINIL